MKTTITIKQAIEILISATNANENLDTVFLYLWDEYANNDAEKSECEDLIRYALTQYQHLERSENE